MTASHICAYTCEELLKTVEKQHSLKNNKESEENFQNKNFVYQLPLTFSSFFHLDTQSILNFYKWNQPMWMREMTFTKLKAI